MHRDLHHFVTRLLAAAMLALVPVLLTAALTLPSTLQRTAAAELRADPHAPIPHMT